MIARSDVQWLNPIDCTMRCVDVAIRQLGYPGIETQMLVWLEGRVDAAALRTRDRTAQPILPGRLPRDWWSPAARPRSILLAVSPGRGLPAAGNGVVFGRSGGRLGPCRRDSLQRPRPDRSPILWNSISSTVPAARMSCSCSTITCSWTTRWRYRSCGKSIGSREADVGPLLPGQQENLVFQHLRQFPTATRREAVQAAIQLQAHALRGRAATLLPVGPAPSGPGTTCGLSRGLSGGRKQPAFVARIIALCGFPCLSMAVLGSAFRAIHEFGPPADPRQDFVAGIGIPLTRNDREMLLFQNLTSAVPIRVQRQDLADRNHGRASVERPTSTAAGRERRSGRPGDDRRLQPSPSLCRMGRLAPGALRILALVRLLRESRTQQASSSAARGSTDLFHAGGPVWPSIGLTLLVNQCHGHLHFQATYDPRLLSPSLAEAFLDFVLTDLLPSSAGVESAAPGTFLPD